MNIFKPIFKNNNFNTNNLIVIIKERPSIVNMETKSFIFGEEGLILKSLLDDSGLNKYNWYFTAINLTNNFNIELNKEQFSTRYFSLLKDIAQLKTNYRIVYYILIDIFVYIHLKNILKPSLKIMSLNSILLNGGRSGDNYLLTLQNLKKINYE
jgi:hypothetical protein